MTACTTGRRLGVAALVALAVGLGAGGTAAAQDVPPVPPVSPAPSIPSLPSVPSVPSIPSVPSLPSAGGGPARDRDSAPGQQYLPLPGGGSLTQTPGGGQHIDLGG